MNEHSDVETTEVSPESIAALEESIKKKNRSLFFKGTLCGVVSTVVILLLVGMVYTFVFPKQDGAPQSNTDTEKNEESFLESLIGGDEYVTAETKAKIKGIREIINSTYLYLDDIDEDAIQDSIIKGYVAGLNEPYTVYYNKAETTALYESTSGSFGGIGVGILQDRTSGLITFTTIYKDCPGEKAGFKEGDIVYKINGEDVSARDIDEVVSKIRGEIGTEVEITVIRDGEEYTAKAKRALIENDTVNYEMKADKIGYIQVTNFETVTLKQFDEALDELNKKKMKGLIIDLRSNPGGNLDTVCKMLDLILPKGVIVSVKDRDGNGQVVSSDADTKLEVPLVVLINGYSASASEIFAGAVQDYEIGTLVGTTTYGKGVVQNIIPLGDGTSLKITSSEYFTPNGRNIHGTGIAPDVEIEYEVDENDLTADNQLDKAIEVLKKEM